MIAFARSLMFQAAGFVPPKVAGLLRSLTPYLLLALTAIFAFAPVSLMQLSLKNDIVSIDYPIKYFITACIRNGVSPFWCNTWGLGFPFESTLTWSIFSPLQLLFSLSGSYSLYTLHVEFMCYVLTAGWSMFLLLHTYGPGNRSFNWMLACSYMLSGFVVGSSQWFTYLTAAAFIPLLLFAYLQLLQTGSLRRIVFFVCIAYIMATSVYAAFLIICTYLLAGHSLYYFLTTTSRQPGSQPYKPIKNIAAGVLFTLLISSPALYATLEVLQHIDRGVPVTQTVFFQSNYIHPQGLLSALLPFANVRLQAPNTEGTMNHLYMGLLPILALPLAVVQIRKQQHSWTLLALAVFFLLCSMGHYTPLRAWLNILPGFAYFRNPGLFRLFFICYYLLFLSQALGHTLQAAVHPRTAQRLLIATALLLAGIFLYLLLVHARELSGSFPELKSFIRGMTHGKAVAISAGLQIVLLTALLLACILRKWQWIIPVAVADLLVNTLLCLPYFTVSSFSLPAVAGILRPVPGFPVQTTPIAEVPTRNTVGNAVWYHANVFEKKVSARPSYFGPLRLRTANRDVAGKQTPRTLVSYRQTDTQAWHSLLPRIQEPSRVQVLLPNHGPATVLLAQNDYPGWQAYLNGTKVPALSVPGEGMQVRVATGGTLEFRYEKKSLLAVALGLDVVVLTSLAFLLLYKIKTHLRGATPKNLPQPH